MPTLEELIADAKTFSDDVVLEIPGEKPVKFKLGDVRGFRAKLTEEEKKAQQRLTELEAERQRLAELGTQGAALLEELSKLRPNKAGGTNDEPDFENDQLYVKKFKPLEQQLTKINESIEKTARSVLDISKAYLHDWYASRWNAIPAEKRPKDKDWRHYLRVAAEQKILDEFNRPDPVEALMRELRPKEEATQAEETKRLREENENLKKQLATPRMPRPGTLGVPGARGTEEPKRYESVDAMLNEAFSDAEIQQIMQGQPLQ